MFIDSHQHFWHYNPLEHIWMNNDMQKIKRDFLPKDLHPLLQNINFEGCIAVQARQSIEETNWLLHLATHHEFIKGVVGWVDLRNDNIIEVLEGYKNEQKLVGVRHVVHDEDDDNFMAGHSFQNGIAALEQFDLTYDLLLFPKHLPLATELVCKFPNQKFVLNHIAKPYIIQQKFTPWQQQIFELAKQKNVYCKLSGMVTEADWKNWSKNDFNKYMDIIIDSFGTDRVMIGSDWPVCTLAAEYQQAMNLVIDYVQQFSSTEINNILGQNCAQFYSIKGH